MHIKNIHSMVETLTSCAKCELDKGIDNVNTEEMGEVAEIIKELCEAEYYAKISKAMDEHEYGEDYDEYGPYDEHSRKGYRGQPRDSRGRYMSRRGYKEPDYRMTPDMYNEHSPEWYRDMDRADGKMYYTEPTMPIHRDVREGRNGMARKSYVEAKEMHKGNTPEDKEAKKKELDKWMNDIGTDIKELVHDMTPEEKTVAKQKLTNLANSL